MKIDMEFARRDDCLDQMLPSDLRLLVSQLAERDAEIKKQADYIASCKRDGAYWWREASGLGTKNVNLQAQLAERDAEIERLAQAMKDVATDYHRAFNENMAYLAFVEAFDVWVGVDIINSDAELDKVIEAREQLRSVVDDN